MFVVHFPILWVLTVMCDATGQSRTLRKAADLGENEGSIVLHQE